MATVSLPSTSVRLTTMEGAHGPLGKDSSNLDLLRSVAVLSVLVCHLLYTFNIRRVFSVNVQPLGGMGVLIFFVHTSLVLLMSMERLNVTGWGLFGAFYVRRIFRLYPLSICCVLAVFVLRIPRMPWDRAFEPVSWSALVNNLLLIHNFRWTAPVIGCLWSLPFELQMYALLPVLFLATRRYTSPALGLGLWLFSIPLAFAYPRLPQLPGIDFLQFVPCFLGGLVAYQFATRNSARRAFWMWPASILAVMAIFIGSNARTRGWVECLLLGLAAPQFRETSLRWLRKLPQVIARYSYGIYLLHPPLMWVAFRKLNMLAIGLRWAIFIVLMTTLCLAAYHWIEAPLLKLGGRLAKGFEPRTSLRAAAAAATGS